MLFIGSFISFLVALILAVADVSSGFDFVILGLVLLAAGHAFPQLNNRA